MNILMALTAQEQARLLAAFDILGLPRNTAYVNDGDFDKINKKYKTAVKAVRPNSKNPPTDPAKHQQLANAYAIITQAREAMLDRQKRFEEEVAKYWKLEELSSYDDVNQKLLADEKFKYIIYKRLSDEDQKLINTLPLGAPTKSDTANRVRHALYMEESLAYEAKEAAAPTPSAAFSPAAHEIVAPEHSWRLIGLVTAVALGAAAFIAGQYLSRPKPDQSLFSRGEIVIASHINGELKYCGADGIYHSRGLKSDDVLRVVDIQVDRVGVEDLHTGEFGNLWKTDIQEAPKDASVPRPLKEYPALCAK